MKSDFIGWALAILLAAIVVVVILNSGSAGAMDICQQKHSYDTCVSLIR